MGIMAGSKQYRLIFTHSDGRQSPIVASKSEAEGTFVMAAVQSLKPGDLLEIRVFEPTKDRRNYEGRRSGADRRIPGSEWPRPARSTET